MSQVIITLEDTEDGQVTMAVAYTSDKGGFDVDSQSHQYAGIMLKLGDEFMARANTEAANEYPGAIKYADKLAKPKLILLS